MGVGVAPAMDNAAVVLGNFLMKMAWHEYRRFSRELSAHQLTLPQFQTLLVIRENNPKCTMGHLACETRQVSATMTGIVDRLVDQGLVERWRQSDDRRKVVVRLTESGQAKVDSVLSARRSQMAGILDQLDEPTRHSLALSLKQYVQVLEGTQ